MIDRIIFVGILFSLIDVLIDHEKVKAIMEWHECHNLHDI